MADVILTTAVDNSGAARGMAELENLAKQTSSAVSGYFTRAFTVGGLTAGFNTLLNAIHDIHHESERFAIDAEALQRIAVPAHEVGIAIETVARAMNMVEIAGYKATQGEKAQIAALHELNLGVLDFNNLKPDQKILAVAEAYEKSSKNADDYAAVAALLGRRFGTELIPAFQAIIAAAKDGGAQLEIFSKQELAAGEAAYKLFQQLKQASLVDLGGPLLIGVARVRAALIDTAAAAESLLGWMARLAQFDIKGAKQFGQQFTDILTLKGPGYTGLQNVLNPPAKPPGAPGAFGAEDMAGLTGGTVGTGTGSGGGSSEQPFEKIADLQEKNRLAALSDNERLNDLVAQRADLQNQLDEGDETRNITNEEGIQLTEQIAKIDEQIIPLQKRITDEADKYAAKIADARDKAEEQATAIDHENQILQLTMSGHGDLAELLKKEWDLQSQIDDAIDAANEAWSEGNVELAEQNELLAQSLETQQQLLAAQAQQKALLDQRGGQAGVDQFGRPVGNTDLTVAGMAAMGLQTGNTAFGLALLASGGNINSPIFQKEYAMYQAQEQLAELQGKQAFSFADTARANAALTAFGAQQTAPGEAFTAAWQQQQLAYFQQVASGNVNATQPDQTALWASILTQFGFTPDTPNQIISQLQAINAKLIGIPGTMTTGL